MPSLRRNLLSLIFSAVIPALSAQDTIKIGEYASLTGKEASFGITSHQGVTLAIEEANVAGGVLGKKIELLAEDTQSKPGESSTSVRKLIFRDKVVAVLGEIVSTRSLEAAPICQAAKIPMISPGSTNVKVTETGNYIFRTCFIDSFPGTILAKFALETLHAKRAALLSSVSSAYSVGLAKYIREGFTSGGGTIVIDPKYSEGDKDFKAQLTTIKAAAPDVIFAPGAYSEGALIVKQARELGITAPFVAGDSWESELFMELGGKATEGVCIASHFSNQDPSPRVQNFVVAYKKRWGGAMPDDTSALGYDAALVLIDAIKRAGTTESSKLRDAIASTKNFDAVTGRITLNDKRDASKKAVILTVKNGQFQFLKNVEP